MFNHKSLTTIFWQNMRYTKDKEKNYAAKQENVPRTLLSPSKHQASVDIYHVLHMS